MPDIRLDTSFPSHPKTRKLRKIGEPGIIDSLITLWCYAGLYKQNGTLSNMDDSDIAFAADFTVDPDDPGKFVQTLINAGFIDDVQPRKLHDWKDHQGWIVKAPQRKKQARQAGLSSGAARRKVVNEPLNRPLNGQSTNRSTDSNEPLNGNELPSSPLPSLPKEKKEEAPASNEAETAEEVSRQIAESRSSVEHPERTPLAQSFEDWRSTDTVWLEQLRMSESLKSQTKAIDGCYSVEKFIESYMGDLSHDVYNRPDKFSDIPTHQGWQRLFRGYIQVGLNDKKLGNFGMKNPMSLTEEKKHEDSKRRKA